MPLFIYVLVFSLLLLLCAFIYFFSCASSSLNFRCSIPIYNIFRSDHNGVGMKSQHTTQWNGCIICSLCCCLLAYFFFHLLHRTLMLGAVRIYTLWCVICERMPETTRIVCVCIIMSSVPASKLLQIYTPNCV